jgi:L-amino acid N-acyltransferase
MRKYKGKNVRIRPALPSDANAIANIWNSAIRDTVATFTNIEKTARTIEEMIAARAHSGHGFYVAGAENAVTGFATYGPFRSGPGYARTMEHSIFLTSDTTGKGIGKSLMNTLEDHARTQGVQSLIAGLSGANTGGISFHKALGYIKVGEIKQAGFKFDRWHDLILMQKLL